MKKKIALTLTMLLLSTIFSFTTVSANQNQPVLQLIHNAEEAKQVAYLTQVEATTDELPLLKVKDTPKIQKIAGNESAFTSTESNILINKNRINISSTSLQLELEIGSKSGEGFATDGLLAISNDNNGLRYAILPTEDGFTAYFIIDKKYTSNNQEIKYNLPSGGSMKLATGNDNSQDGSILIYDNGGNISGAIGTSRVFDAKGTLVESSQQLSKGVITNTINTNQDLEYPLVSIVPFSTATNFYTYFNGYIERLDYGAPGCTSLGLYPKDWRTQWLSASEKEVRWNAVLYISSFWRYWKNTSSMKAQFMCHLNLAIFTDPEWNLEPDRTGTPSALNSCNPTSTYCP